MLNKSGPGGSTGSIPARLPPSLYGLMTVISLTTFSALAGTYQLLFA